MITIAKPGVTLVCQWERGKSAEDAVVKKLSWSIHPLALWKFSKFRAGRTIVINGIHPSCFTRWNWETDDVSDFVAQDDNLSDNDYNYDDQGRGARLQARRRRQKLLAPLSESLLELAFSTAVNAAGGGKIIGNGLMNLPRWVLKAPLLASKGSEAREQ